MPLLVARSEIGFTAERVRLSFPRGYCDWQAIDEFKEGTLAQAGPVDEMFGAGFQARLILL